MIAPPAKARTSAALHIHCGGALCAAVCASRCVRGPCVRGGVSVARPSKHRRQRSPCTCRGSCHRTTSAWCSSTQLTTHLAPPSRSLPRLPPHSSSSRAPAVGRRIASRSLADGNVAEVRGGVGILRVAVNKLRADFSRRSPSIDASLRFRLSRRVSTFFSRPSRSPPSPLCLSPSSSSSPLRQFEGLTAASVMVLMDFG